MSGIINRNIFKKAKRLLTLFPTLAIIGARQCGKTTLAKQISPEWRYIDLEKGSDFDLVSEDFDLFFKQYKSDVIFDEVQHLPALLKELRHVIDNDRNRKKRFIITGSGSFELLSGISETLAGRIAIIELGTLKMNEFYQKPLSGFYSMFNNKIYSQTLNNICSLKPQFNFNEVQKHFFKGGYPEPVLSKKETFYSNWMENYFRTYINRDIRSLFPKLNMVRYRKFIQMLSSLNSTIINRSQLARSIDTSEVTIKDYLEIAHGSFIWRDIYPYEKAVSKSIIKSPRGIFRDQGLAHYLQRIISLKDLEIHPTIGQSFEAFVIEEIINGLNSIMITNWQYYYYRTKNQAEVDFILEGPFGTIPIEIKYGTNTRKSKILSLLYFMKTNKLPVGFVINNSDRVEYITENVVQIPAGML